MLSLLKFFYEICVKILIFNKMKKSLAAHLKSSVAHKRAAAYRFRTTDLQYALPNNLHKSFNA